MGASRTYILEAFADEALSGYSQPVVGNRGRALVTEIEITPTGRTAFRIPVESSYLDLAAPVASASVGRATVTNSGGGTFRLNVADLVVGTVPSQSYRLTSISVAGASSTSASFSGVRARPVSIIYQWESAPTPTGPFTLVDGLEGRIVDVTLQPAEQGWYRALVTAPGYTVRSLAVEVYRPGEPGELATECESNEDCGAAQRCQSSSFSQGSRCVPQPVAGTTAIPMAYIPAGQFFEGSPVDEFLRAGADVERGRVSILTNDFFIMETELTNAQWTGLGGSSVSTSACSAANCPVFGITLASAAWAANRLSEREGLTPCYTLCADGSSGTRNCSPETLLPIDDNGYSCDGYRLPTEAEWEYAARAGTTTATWAGNLLNTPSCLSTSQPVLGDISWWCGNTSSTQKIQVGQLAANPAGLYDMIGNTREWAIGGYSNSPRGGMNPYRLLSNATVARGADTEVRTAGAFRVASRETLTSTSRGGVRLVRPVSRCPSGQRRVNSECLRALSVPSGFLASQGTEEEAVALSWDTVPNATGYHVYRDGIRITTLPVATTNFRDTGAPAATQVPATVIGLTASQNDSTGIRLNWNAASVAPAVPVFYQVEAVASEWASAVTPAITGFRGPKPVLGYLITPTGRSTIAAGPLLTYLDTSAPIGSIALSAAVASTNLPNQVDLRISEPTVTQASTLSYRVQAVNANGSSSLSSAVTGQRTVAPFSYEWQWSSASNGTYASLPASITNPASDFTLEPGPGRFYRVIVSSPPVATRTSLSVYGQRRRTDDALAQVCASDSECIIGQRCPTELPEIVRRCVPVLSPRLVAVPFSYIPAGTFTMGSPAGENGRISDGTEDQQEVTLTHAYFMTTTEITRFLWSNLAATDSLGTSASPVTSVTWWSALWFANYLSTYEGLEPCYDIPLPACTGAGSLGTLNCSDFAMPGLSGSSSYECDGYRLPTEAEFERAARAGTLGATPQGELIGDTSVCNVAQAVLDNYAWWCRTSSSVRTVSTKFANPWGLFDMAGNAAEWTFDRYRFSLQGGTDPEWTSEGTTRTVRGGAASSRAGEVRSASRDGTRSSGIQLSTIGFRLVRTVPAP